MIGLGCVLIALACLLFRTILNVGEHEVEIERLREEFRELEKLVLKGNKR